MLVQFFIYTGAAGVSVNPLQPIAFEQVCTCSVHLAIQ